MSPCFTQHTGKIKRIVYGLALTTQDSHLQEKISMTKRAGGARASVLAALACAGSVLYVAGRLAPPPEIEPLDQLPVAVRPALPPLKHVGGAPRQAAPRVEGRRALVAPRAQRGLPAAAAAPPPPPQRAATAARGAAAACTDRSARAPSPLTPAPCTTPWSRRRAASPSAATPCASARPSTRRARASGRGAPCAAGRRAGGIALAATSAPRCSG